MTEPATEVLDASILEPLFADIEPSHEDIVVVRGLIRAIGGEHLVRLQQITNVSRIEIGSSARTEADKSVYRVDMTRPRSRGFLLVGTATWVPVPSGVHELFSDDRSHLYHLTPEQLEPLHTPEQIFQAYDKRPVMFSNSSNLRGWFSPDIHTAAGMEELVAILTKGEDVDD